MATADDAITDAPLPRANPELIGHESAERALLSAWNAGRMPHAWLLGGPRGIGKATLAYRFARFVLAGGGSGGLFGGPPDSLVVPSTDPVFRRIAAAGHADLVTLEPGMIHPDTNRPTQEIVVPLVRRATEFLLKTAAEGGWRVVIVDEAEAMNRNAANALLKILEEPPPRCLLLLVSHSPGRLLPTIRSRCRTLTLQPLAEADVATLLGRYRPGLDPAERDTLVGLAKGSIGRAIELADRGGVELHNEIASLLTAMPEFDIPAAHGFADRLARSGEDAIAGFRLAMELIADWISRQVGPGQAMPEPWFEAWDRARRLASATEGLNLDRKLALLTTFLAIQRAAATASTAARHP